MDHFKGACSGQRFFELSAESAAELQRQNGAQPLSASEKAVAHRLKNILLNQVGGFRCAVGLEPQLDHLPVFPEPLIKVHLSRHPSEIPVFRA